VAGDDQHTATFLQFTGKAPRQIVGASNQDDTPAQRLMRIKQCNLVGPAGYISMEDGCIGGFVQRGIAAASEQASVVEMGGRDTASEESRVSEAAVRGFWKDYRRHMGF